MRMMTLVFLAFVAVCQGQSYSPFPVNDNCPVKVAGPTAAFDTEHDKDTVGGGIPILPFRHHSEPGQSGNLGLQNSCRLAR